MTKPFFWSLSLCLFFSCTQASSSNTETQENKKLVPTARTADTPQKKTVSSTLKITNPEFKKFVGLFSPIKSPITLTDETTQGFKRKKAIPEAWTTAYICDIKGSDFICINEDPDPNMAYNLLQSYYPYGRLEISGAFVSLIYQFYDFGYAQNYLATYTPDGQLLSRITLSGSKPRAAALHAHINDVTSLGTQEITYAFKKKGQEGFIKKIKTTRYKIRSNGKIIPLSMDETLDAILDVLVEIPEVIAYKKEVIAQGKKFKLMPISNYPSPTEASYYIKVGEDNGTQFVTWQHFYVHPLDLEVHIYNLLEDEKIDLHTWRNQ